MGGWERGYEDKGETIKQKNGDQIKIKEYFFLLLIKEPVKPGLFYKHLCQ